MTSKQWIVELSNADGEIVPMGKYSDYSTAQAAVKAFAFGNGETLDQPDDSGNDEFVFDIAALDSDGEWIYDTGSYIIRRSND